MTEGLLKQLDIDLTTIPPVIAKEDSERDRVMRLCAHAFLRLWTRIALESGQRLSLSPSQFVLGTYDGQMRWNLSESVDYKGIAETYIIKGEERARWFFALEEEKVKNKPVFVNYLVYDVPLDEFDLSKAVAVLKQVFPQWLESVSTGDDKPLWNMCKEKLECVGV